MSAWIVSKAHIDALVSTALRAGLGQEGLSVYYPAPNGEGRIREDITFDHASEVGRRLWLENLASVAYQYPDDADGQWPGPIGLTRAAIEGYAFRQCQALHVGAAFKAIGCFKYQSCEHPTWKQSFAYHFCQQLKGALESQIPGYEAAPWGIEAEHLQPSAGFVQQGA